MFFVGHKPPMHECKGTQSGVCLGGGGVGVRIGFHIRCVLCSARCCCFLLLLVPCYVRQMLAALLAVGYVLPGGSGSLGPVGCALLGSGVGVRSIGSGTLSDHEHPTLVQPFSTSVAGPEPSLGQGT